MLGQNFQILCNYQVKKWDLRMFRGIAKDPGTHLSDHEVQLLCREQNSICLTLATYLVSDLLCHKSFILKSFTEDWNIRDNSCKAIVLTLSVLVPVGARWPNRWET